MKKLIKKIKNYLYSSDSDLILGVFGIFGCIYFLVSLESRFSAFFSGVGFFACGGLILDAVKRFADKRAADKE